MEITNATKSYAEYILGIYTASNPKAEQGSFYLDLKNFIDNGRVKDVIYRTTRPDVVITWLYLQRKELANFLRDTNGVAVKTFGEYLMERERSHG